jgi:hypothetical protein
MVGRRQQDVTSDSQFYLPVTGITSDGSIDLPVVGILISTDRLVKITVIGIHHLSLTFGCGLPSFNCSVH